MMRFHKTPLVSVAFLCILCAQYSLAAPLVNGDFETGALAPWFQDRDFSSGPREDWNVVSSDAHGGMFSATCANNLELRQNLAPIPVSQITEISFWLRNPALPVGAVLEFFYTDLTSSTFGVSPTTTAWEFYDVTGHLTPGRTLSAISIFGYTSGQGLNDRTLLDDFRVIAVPEPSLALLFTLGLGAYVIPRSLARKRNANYNHAASRAPAR
jgi:hypothetical protein